ncbi:MAG: mitochondrial fission ELM1 family protein [Pseudomonadota bacterium]
MAGRDPEAGTVGGAARTPNTRAGPLVVWRFTDGKPGHDSQSQGLVEALRAQCVVEEHSIHVADCRAGLAACLSGRITFGQDLPDPALLIGAGHATHLPMLNARRVRGGRVVVLMKPTLPTGWFDLCVIPMHDRPRRRENILLTRGVLNRVRPAAQRDGCRGLILVGGPSAHVSWTGDAVAAQIAQLPARSTALQWTLTTSRRTPAGFLERLGAVPGLTIVPCDRTGPDWLPAQLAGAAQVWVTQDSVSMIFEALTSGAAVGLIDVPWRNPRDRVAQGVVQLVREGLVTAFPAWQGGTAPQPPAVPFDEAARVAAWILEQWPDVG